MARKPLEKTGFVIAMLRRATYMWPAFTEALGRARVSRGVYRCAHCTDHFGRKEIHKDHIKPVVPLTGWDDWNGFINRLFCTADDLQILCKACHKKKTKAEGEVRKRYRKKT